MIEHFDEQLDTSYESSGEHEFPGLGARTMRLNARQVFYEGGANTTILLGIEDVTAQRVLEREKDELLRQFEEARAFAQAIVDTVREPFLVLDQNLRVLAASRSFYSTFEVSPADTQGRPLYALGDGQWAIPGLRLLLEKIVPERGVMEDYEVEHVREPCDLDDRRQPADLPESGC